MDEFKDFENKIQVTMAETGELRLLGGGVEIKVLDPVVFPWHKVFTILLEIEHQIWITREENFFTVKTKPPSI